MSDAPINPIVEVATELWLVNRKWWQLWKPKVLEYRVFTIEYADGKLRHYKCTWEEPFNE